MLKFLSNLRTKASRRMAFDEHLKKISPVTHTIIAYLAPVLLNRGFSVDKNENRMPPVYARDTRFMAALFGLVDYLYPILAEQSEQGSFEKVWVEVLHVLFMENAKTALDTFARELPKKNFDDIAREVQDRCDSYRHALAKKYESTGVKTDPDFSFFLEYC